MLLSCPGGSLPNHAENYKIFLNSSLAGVELGSGSTHHLELSRDIESGVASTSAGAELFA
jgi:hypothetical protein